MNILVIGPLYDCIPLSLESYLLCFNIFAVELTITYDELANSGSNASKRCCCARNQEHSPGPCQSRRPRMSTSPLQVLEHDARYQSHRFHFLLVKVHKSVLLRSGANERSVTWIGTGLEELDGGDERRCNADELRDAGGNQVLSRWVTATDNGMGDIGVQAESLQVVGNGCR